MAEQGGLELDDGSTAWRGEGFALCAEGSWERVVPDLDLNEAHEALERARSCVGRVSEEAAREAFARALDAVKAALVEAGGETCGGARVTIAPWALSRPMVVEAGWQARVRECVGRLVVSSPGSRWSERASAYGVAGEKALHIYVPGAGTVHIETERGTTYLWFELGESAELRVSYLDDAERIELVEDQWRPQMCGMALQDGASVVPGVTALSVWGRRCAVTSARYGVECSEGSAWELVPKALWRGEVLDRKRSVAAWSKGELERGDMRGVEVSVGGARYVLGKPLMLVDNRSRETRDAWLTRGSTPKGAEVEAASGAQDAGEQSRKDQAELF